MSVKVLGFVWDSKLPRDMKFIALANADHANHDGTSVYPGRDTVAEMTGYSRRSVELITQQLVKTGILIPDGISELNTKRYKFDLKALADYRPPGWKETGGEDSSGGRSSRQVGGEENRTGGGEDSSPKPSRSKPEPKPITGLLFQTDPENKALAAQEGFNEEWRAYRLHRKKLRCPMTERAEELILETLAERPQDAVDALRVAQRKGWRGFEWDWYDKAKRGESPGGRQPRERVDYKNLTKDTAV